MAFNIEAIIWYLFLIDSLGAGLISICCVNWYKKRFKSSLSRHLPLTKAWAGIYLILVLWGGSALYRNGVLPW